MISVGIIGAGPAGLLAAYAVERMGHDPIVMAPYNRSRISPVQCLQKVIPDTNIPGIKVFYGKQGTKEVFAAKAYGDANAQTSWDKIEPGDHMVWPLDETYDWLWSRYNGTLDGNIVEVDDLPDILNSLQVVISTAPMVAFCVQDHHFTQVGTQVLERETSEGDPSKDFPSVILNGNAEDPWYRFSLLKGHMAWEYPSEGLAAPMEAELGIRPIGNNCDCFPKLHRVGRFGKWSRGVQNHHAFRDTVALLSCEGLGDKQ